MADVTYKTADQLPIMEEVTENTYVLVEESGTLKRVCGELPTTVPVIESATVGQTVVVKAVDENGRPTEWEAVDAGSGGSNNPTAVFKFAFTYDNNNPVSVTCNMSAADVLAAMLNDPAGLNVIGYSPVPGSSGLVPIPGDGAVLTCLLKFGAEDVLGDFASFIFAPPTGFVEYAVTASSDGFTPYCKFD